MSKILIQIKRNRKFYLNFIPLITDFEHIKMEDKKALAKKVVQQMLSNDLFSQWLGISLLVIKPGFCQLSMKVLPEMTNGFKTAHGGISFSFADSALAFASNSHGIQSVSIETSISHTKPVFANDILTASCKEENLTKRIGIYTVRVENQHQEQVALFKGTVFRTGKPWFE